MSSHSTDVHLLKIIFSSKILTVSPVTICQYDWQIYMYACNSIGKYRRKVLQTLYRPKKPRSRTT